MTTRTYTASDRLPALRPYLAAAWRQRALASELAAARVEAEHANLLLGQLWVVLRPLLLAAVYMVLIIVLTGSGGSDRLLIVLLGLFWFELVRMAALQGARSVTDNAGLVLSSPFPRILLPAAAVLHALRVGIPGLAVYAVMHVALGGPVDVAWFVVVPLLGVTAVLALGVAAVLAATAVRVADVVTVLPYALRVAVYLSPVLYRLDEAPAWLQAWLRLNPLTWLLDVLQRAVLDGQVAWGALLGAAAAALLVAVVGIGAFVAAERSFGARL